MSNIARIRQDVRVSIICESGGYGDLLGLDRFDSEEDIVSRLGEPSGESISESGLSRIISFAEWKVAYELVEGRISQRCVTESGVVAYRDEYEEESSPTQ